MKITFPHMGNAWIPIKGVLESFGHEVVIPPFISRRTLELGMKYGPEFACLPLKLNIGNFIEAMEKGADTIVMAGGCGPCRFGYYGQVEKEILRDFGYDFEMIIVEPPAPGYFKQFKEQGSRLINGQRPLGIMKNVYLAYQLAKEADEVQRLANTTRPRETEKGKTNRILRAMNQKLLQAKGIAAMRKVVQETSRQLQEIPLKRGVKPLRVGIVGEIYTVIEPFTNLSAEERLGSMGVEVERSLYVSHWIYHHIFLPLIGIKPGKKYDRVTEGYIGKIIGGHARETVGDSIRYSRKGFDGVIQFLPFTCMPEIVAESILPTVQEEGGIPILTLIIDELTGEAGYLTRLEAFIDLLSRKKELKPNNDECLVLGN